jgi:hypothetical protein
MTRVQRFKEIAIGLSYKVNVKRLYFSTGISFPYHKISDFDVLDTYVGSNAYTYSKTVKGGAAYGINNVSSVNVRVVSSLFLYARFSIGFLKTKIGGHIKDSTDYVDPLTPDSSFVANVSFYESNQISNPEFSIGLGYTFESRNKTKE